MYRTCENIYFFLKKIACRTFENTCHCVWNLHRHRRALRARLAGGEGWRVVRGLRAKGESQSPKIGACEQDSLAGWYLLVGHCCS